MATVTNERADDARLDRSATQRLRQPTRRWTSWVCVLLAVNVAVLLLAAIWWPHGLALLADHWRVALSPLEGGASHSYVATLAAVMAIDLLALGPRRSAIGRVLHGSRSELVDTVYGVGAALGGLTVAVLAVSGGLTLLSGSLAVRWLGALSMVQHLPAVAHIPIYFIVYDFLSYWYHRWCHHNQLLWSLHAFHHRAESFVILTGNRVHPLEIAIREMLIMVPMVLIGTPPAVPLLLITARRIIDQLQHSMVPWTYGWFGRWLLYSPVGHRIHHSPERQHWDSNYGDIFPIWDRCFGTWHAGDEVNERVGLGEQSRACASSSA